jgi:hypothetical protein
MQPALLGTRLESLHGQEVEIKVYGPGQTHECINDGWKPCPFCQKLSVYDPDRRGIRLKDIERRWPVALGITEGYHEPISGSMEYLSPPCVFKCLNQPRLTKADIKLDAQKKAESKAEYDFRWANLNARARLDRKRAANPTWTPAAREARSAYLKRCARERAEMDRDREWQHEQRQAEKAAYQLRVEKAKVPCSANECEMGDWIQLDWRQFHDLMGRKATTLETRAVRGCEYCPRIESQLAPHFGAL